jgi:hypothetical protein
MNSGSETESQRTTWSGTGSPDKTARCRRNPGDIGIIRCCRGPLRGGLSARGAQRTARRHRTRRISRNSKLFSGRYTLGRRISVHSGCRSPIRRAGNGVAGFTLRVVRKYHPSTRNQKHSPCALEHDVAPNGHVKYGLACLNRSLMV